MNDKILGFADRPPRPSSLILNPYICCKEVRIQYIRNNIPIIFKLHSNSFLLKQLNINKNEIIQKIYFKEDRVIIIS